MENRVNVLYLTTKCNLACEYCYEESSRLGLPEQITVNEEIIDKYLEEIRIRERGNTSTVVVMGGEPFMKPYLLYYTIKKMGEINHRWGVSIVTNGTMVGINIKVVKKILEVTKENTHLNFEISYDASGHFRRMYRNSTISSKPKVEKTIQQFIKNKVPFKISYTIHKDNYDNFIKDCIYIFEKFGTDYLLGIKTSIYCQELSEKYGNYEESVDKLKPYANMLFKKYGVPICDLVCGVSCFQCDKSNFVGNSYCGPGGIKYTESKREVSFDNWER